MQSGRQMPAVPPMSPHEPAVDALPTLLGNSSLPSSGQGGTTKSGRIQAPASEEPTAVQASTEESTHGSTCARLRGPGWTCATVVTEAASGVTVALAMVPEAVAFSLAAGLKPHVGLVSSFMICLLTTLLGGRPAMVSGATGSILCCNADGTYPDRRRPRWRREPGETGASLRGDWLFQWPGTGDCFCTTHQLQASWRSPES
mmetsp:Transcript_150972/g.366680  ORF Transcript_150972/g.366680 Transcript_150972/m.366680 type:complete len:202 (-) Transcript_150972:1729-2334(-)